MFGSGTSSNAEIGQARTSFPLLFLMIFIPFGFGHFISYLFRTINAVIFQDLAIDLNLPAGSLGLLTGVYFLSFAGAQLPLGVLLDRHGPRVVQVPMLLIAAAGSLIFAFSHSEFGLLVGRGLIGLGVAGSLMSAIKACSIWLPPERLSLSTACLLAVGGLGALTSTTPLHAVLTWLSWREAFMVLAGLTVLASLMIHFAVSAKYTPKNTGFSEMFRAVGKLYMSWTFWRLALYSVVPHATYMAVLALWMGVWLRDVARLDSSHMANALMFGALGMIAGSLIFGWITDYLRRFNIQPIMVCGAGVVMFVLFQTLMISGLPVSPWVIVVGFSFFGASTTMNYAIVAQSVDPVLAGRVSTSFNMIVFLLAFGVQWMIGGIIGSWDVTPGGGYPISAYNWSLGFLISLQIPGILLWLAFKPWRLKA